MNSLVASLLAQTHPLKSMGRHFRHGGSNVDLGQLFLWICLLLLIAVVAWYVAQRFARRQQPGYRNPRKLFLDLCRAHGLNRERRQLLSQLARHQSLASPARLFLEPELFEPARLSPALADRRLEIRRIRDTIFGKRLKPQA